MEEISTYLRQTYLESKRNVILQYGCPYLTFLVSLHKMATHYLVCIVLALLASLVVRCDEQIYSENLFVRTLPDGKVLSHFQFKQTWNISIDEFLIEKSGNLDE